MQEELPYFKHTNDFLLRETGNSIIDYARYYGYPETEVKILQLEGIDDKRLKPVIVKDADLKSLYCRMGKNQKAKTLKGPDGKRSWTAYFKQIVTGWIWENITTDYLENVCQFKVMSSGCDRERKILDNFIEQVPDFHVCYNGMERNIELTVECNEICARDKYIEKRCGTAFQTMREKGEGTIWLYLDLFQKKYVLTDFAREVVSGIVRWHGHWGKDVCRYNLEDHGKIARDIGMLKDELQDCVGKSLKGNVQPPPDWRKDEKSPPHDHDIINGRIVRIERTVDNPVVDNMQQRLQTPPIVKKDPPPPRRNIEVPKEESLVEQGESDIDYGDGDFV